MWKKKGPTCTRIFLILFLGFLFLYSSSPPVLQPSSTLVLATSTSLVGVSAHAASFNIILTTSGRRNQTRSSSLSLSRMLSSIAPQLFDIDHLTVISDGGHSRVKEALENVKCLCKKRHIANKEPLGFWGHGSRTRWQNELDGDFHLNGDDDDIYDPSAMQIIRQHVAEAGPGNHLLVFHMIRRWDGIVELIPAPGTAVIREKAIGTPCGVYSKLTNMPTWQGKYGGDASFYVSLAERMNFTFIPQVIYQVGQDEDLLSVKDSYL
jgi:hypothetical protein